MTSVLLDTHAWVWSLAGDKRLSGRAVEEIERADSVHVSPISFFEIAQKVRLGKWPEMEPYVERLPAILDEQGGLVATLDPVVATSAGVMTWAHRDPFDRLIAATALRFAFPLVSADHAFDGVVSRIW